MQIQADGKGGRLHWLDVADDYLTQDGAKLKAELAFDGTHMAPTFLQTVSRAIASCD
jgi:hypothetical protein